MLRHGGTPPAGKRPHAPESPERLTSPGNNSPALSGRWRYQASPALLRTSRLRDLHPGFRSAVMGFLIEQQPVDRLSGAVIGLRGAGAMKERRPHRGTDEIRYEATER